MALPPRLVAAAATALLAVTLGVAPSAAAEPPPLPVIMPTPQSVERVGSAVNLAGRVEIIIGDDTDAAALRQLEEALTKAGVERIDSRRTPGNAPARFVLGSAARADVKKALNGTDVPDAPESYVVQSTRDGAPQGTIVLAGSDPAGQYYAVQSFRQTLTVDGDARSAAGVRIVDSPAMPLRGTIEGFYGDPWTHEERIDQFAFYGDMKMNTYIYAPKDDPFHRERWREPYPADKLDQLAELATAASAHHVRFTFALSPGNTICYSSESDFDALLEKFEQMWAAGVRAFNVPFDDIDISRWNCDADREAYGEPSSAKAGAAQAAWLDRIQHEFIETHAGAHPLQMVPTEYSDLADTGYKQALRTMDEDIVVMWTGPDVVPPAITLEQADRAATVYGGRVFVWDNYPVNDFWLTSGRLLLAPYAKRDLGLSEHVVGIVANPMNQAAASKIALVGVADFTWNDRDYDAERTWKRAMDYLADGDDAASDALEVFADLSRLAPTFGPDPWQPQSPALTGRIDAFWSAWDTDPAAAIDALRAYAQRIQAAPATIRGGAVDRGFVSDARPWLDATELWGQGTVTLLEAVDARLAGDGERSDVLAAEAAALRQQAAAIRVTPAENRWGAARVRIADGVLDVLHSDLERTLQELDSAG